MYRQRALLEVQIVSDVKNLVERLLSVLNVVTRFCVVVVLPLVREQLRLHIRCSIVAEVSFVDGALGIDTVLSNAGFRVL